MKKEVKNKLHIIFTKMNKDKSKSGKAYFYYDDESIQDRFGTLPEKKKGGGII